MPLNDAAGLEGIKNPEKVSPIKHKRPNNAVRLILGNLPPTPAPRKKKPKPIGRPVKDRSAPRKVKGPGACVVCGVALGTTGSSYYATKCKEHASHHRKGISPVTPEQRAKGHETMRAALKMYREAQQEGKI